MAEYEERVRAAAEADERPTRTFTVRFADGYVLHGVQFPSGRCVLDDSFNGLVEAATAFENLQLPSAHSVVEWADAGPAVGAPCGCCPDVETMQDNHQVVCIPKAQLAALRAAEAERDAMLGHYSRALDELWRMRVAAAYEAYVVAENVLEYATLPKAARQELTGLRHRAAAAARGETAAAYKLSTEWQARVMDDAGAPATLTRAQWERPTWPPITPPKRGDHG